MQDKWKDLIPFYVADTLSDADKQAIEAYLAQCGDPCQEEIEEWRVIASATWQHVNINNLDLPPLSQRVLQEVAKDAPFRASNKVITSTDFQGDNAHQAPVYPRTESKRKQRRSSRFPVTMVAAFMTMVVFGGILLSQLTPDDIEPETLVQITNVQDDVTEMPVTVTQPFGGSIGIQPTNPNGSGIIATPTPVDPTAPPPPTVIFTPTAFPSPQALLPASTLPPNSGGGIAGGPCTIRNDTQGALTTYRNASFDAEPVQVFPQGAEANIDIVFNGWYMLSYGNWVSGDNITMIGNCSQVWTATPTAIGDTNGGNGTGDNGVPNCMVNNTSGESVNLYQWANESSPINGYMDAGEQVNVYVGENGWYQVYYAQWVNGADVTVAGEGCNTLWIPTPTIPAGTTRTPIPTPANTTMAVVTTTSAILQGSPAEIGTFIEEVAQGTNLSILAHNNMSGTQRWYLVRSPQNRVGWVSISNVDVIPNDSNVFPAATVPFIPSATPTMLPITPVLENWSYIATIVEQGCPEIIGGNVGDQTTTPVQLERLGSVVNLTNTNQVTYRLDEVSPNAFYGIVGRGATTQISLSFTSSTTYSATEIITREDGCIIRSTWAGTKQ
jgi:hypothetical protein